MAQFINEVLAANEALKKALEDAERAAAAWKRAAKRKRAWLAENAKMNSVLIMRLNNPDYLPPTERQLKADNDALWRVVRFDYGRLAESVVARSRKALSDEKRPADVGMVQDSD